MKPPKFLSRIGDRTLVAGAAAAVILSCIFLGVQVYESVVGHDQIQSTADRLRSLHVEIDRLHMRRFQAIAEVVETGDPEAARAFREVDVAESDALMQLSAEAVTPEEQAAASDATFAYHTLATYESDALALALAGRGQRAAEALYGREYGDARIAFGEALLQAREAIAPRLAPMHARIDGAVRATMIVGPIAALGTLVLLGLILGRLASLAERRRSLEADLAAAQADIARREREMHANMIARFPAPTAEFEFAPALKLVAWLKQRGVEDLERWLKVYPGEIRKLAPQFAVLRANKPAAELLKAGDVGQLKELERWIPDRSLHQCVLAILRALWNKSHQVSTTIDVRTLDGQERTLELRGALVPRAKGKAPTLMACLTDISEVSSLRRDLDAIKDGNEQSRRKSEEFLGAVSRDLRTALDGVTGMAAALDRTRLDKEQRESLAVIRDSGELMRDALDRARDYRRLEAGDLEIAAEAFDVSTVVQAVNARFSPRARAKNLRFRMAIDEAARIKVVGDESRVRQILTKLVANAIEYTPHGEVEARVGLDSEPDGSSAQLVLTVRDTGAGLTPGEIRNATEDGQGAGGGLALCRRLCEAMGGRLEISSSSDYGTTITARMQVTEAKAQDKALEPETGASTAPFGRRLTLLAADDNAINRIVLKDMLEPLDVDLTLVENGADAIAAWRARAFDAILLDIQMPLLSGYDVTREIRKLEVEEGRARTPIIAVSASVMRSEVEACLAAGMDSHVAKPIELAKLKAALTAATAQTEGRGEAAA
jgi:signal transduction histidine kinase/ActR/RegA family two-component response regulator